MPGGGDRGVRVPQASSLLSRCGRLHFAGTRQLGAAQGVSDAGSCRAGAGQAARLAARPRGHFSARADGEGSASGNCLPLPTRLEEYDSRRTSRPPLLLPRSFLQPKRALALSVPQHPQPHRSTQVSSSLGGGSQSSLQRHELPQRKAAAALHLMLQPRCSAPSP